MRERVLLKVWLGFLLFLCESSLLYSTLPTLWVLTWALNRAPQSELILCIRAQLSLTLATSTMAAGVRKEVRGLPTKALARASLEGSRAKSPLAVEVWWTMLRFFLFFWEEQWSRREGRKKKSPLIKARSYRQRGGAWHTWAVDILPSSFFPSSPSSKTSTMSKVIKENVSRPRSLQLASSKLTEPLRSVINSSCVQTFTLRQLRCLLLH